MFCKKGHKYIAKHSINEDQSTEETGKIGTIVQCIYLYHRLFLHQSRWFLYWDRQKKRGGKEGGLNGGVVHFIAGIKDEYNKIAFIDLQSNNIVFIWCTNGSSLLINSHICTCPFNTVNFLP